MKKNEQSVGVFQFDESPIIIADPMYIADKECQLSGIRVKPGAYNCLIVEDKDMFGCIRVFGCAIEHATCTAEDMNRCKQIGDVWVDTASVGFFQTRQADVDWDAVRINDHNNKWEFNNHGFVTESGYGDGEYTVYAYYNANGEIVRIYIGF